jgi:hypothetical protein
MVTIRSSAPAPNRIASRASDDGNCSTQTPLILDGVVCAPSRGCRFGADGTNHDALEVGMFMMKIDDVCGVYMKLTPKMLRDIGGAMIATADKIDMHAKIQAAAALAKAAGK